MDLPAHARRIQRVRSARQIVAATLTAAGVAAGLALASGGPPPREAPAPAPGTVVAHGTGHARVGEPARRTNRSVERKVRAATGRAIPRAAATARAEAARLAAAAGLRPGKPVGIARDVSPVGYYDEASGRFGPGRWCGPITTWRSGERRTHHGCQKPKRVAVRVTLTVAAE